MIYKLCHGAPCWCGSRKSYSDCHESFDRKISALKKQGFKVPPKKIIKNEEQLKGIRESCKINIEVLDRVSEKIAPGISTGEINELVHELTTGMGAIPAPLNYNGFPYSVCTSVNDQVCHGFPSKDVILKDGDIINVDCSTIYKGYFSDSSRMFTVGEVSPEAKKLVDVTKECIYKGLEKVIPYRPLGDMSQAVQNHAVKNGYSVVREIGGHGVGLKFHEEPFVSYVIPEGTGMVMAPGMVFTIEPMVNMGKPDVYIDGNNDWEVYTMDGSLSAQWEIMVLVTEEGNEVLCY